MHLFLKGDIRSESTCPRAWSVLFGLFLLLLSPLQGTAQSDLEKANAAFNTEQYDKAFEYYQQIIDVETDQAGILSKAGESAYRIGELNHAEDLLIRAIESTSNIDPEVFRYLGMSFHESHEFEDAIAAYKSFIQQIKGNHPYRENVLLRIKYCSSGLQLQNREEAVYSENMGPVVNSSNDDYAAVYSPTVEQRVYFSTTRPVKDENGASDTGKSGKSGIVFSEQLNGQWNLPEPLPRSINGPAWERLEAFSDGGDVLYFFRGEKAEFGDVLVDSFSVENRGYRDFPVFDEVINPGKGDHALYFFDAKTLLFSSNRPGGEGGFDLYISEKINGRWTDAVNLGPEINSAYDETDPWLAADGRTLYFSSNNPRSIGGYDIFQAEYDDQKASWTNNHNPGIPINSANDDRYFSLADDGYTGIVSSDRIGGQGGQDLYITYFKNRRPEQNIVSSPAHFGRVEFEGKIEEHKETEVRGERSEGSALKISPLYYEEKQLLTAQNKSQLDHIYQLTGAESEGHLLIESHSNFDGPPHLDLYFAAKQAMKVYDYFMDKGLDTGRISMRAVGNQYPVSVENASGSRSGQKGTSNRRIEFYLYSEAGELLSTSEKSIRKAFNSYKKKLIGLSFRVQVASRGGMYDHPALKILSDLVVEIDGSTGSPVYRYLVGLTEEIDEAGDLLESVKQQGIKGARIIPYFDGQRMSESEIRQMSVRHEQLDMLIEN